MSPLRIGIWASALVSGPPLWFAVSDGDMTGGGAVARAAVVALACAVGASFVLGLVSDYDTEARKALADGSPTNGGGHPGKVVGEAFVELQNGIAAFDARGIVLRDLDSGLIDFPSVRDGLEVYLCWIDGEDDIGFWHDLDAGYAGRQPL